MEVDVVDLGAEHVSFKEDLDFFPKEAPEDLRNGEAPVSDLEVLCRYSRPKRQQYKLAMWNAGKKIWVWDVMLKNLRRKLQILSHEPFAHG